MTGFCQFQAVGTEGIGINHLTASVNVLAVNGRQQLRIGQIQQFRQPAGGQAPLLQDRTHRTVQKQQFIL